MKKILALLMGVLFCSYSLSADNTMIIDEKTYLSQIGMIVDDRHFPSTSSFLKKDLKKIVFNTKKLNSLTMDMCILSANMKNLIDKDTRKPYSIKKYKEELVYIYKSFFKDMYAHYQFDIKTVDSFLVALASDIAIIDRTIKK